jgi:hypothetical protein
MASTVGAFLTVFVPYRTVINCYSRERYGTVVLSTHTGSTVVMSTDGSFISRELVYSQLMRLPEKYQQALQQTALHPPNLPPTPSTLTNPPSPTDSLPPTQPVKQLPSQTSSLRTTLPAEQRSQPASVAVGGTLPPATVSEPRTSVVVKSGNQALFGESGKVANLCTM